MAIIQTVNNDERDPRNNLMSLMSGSNQMTRRGSYAMMWAATAREGCGTLQRCLQISLWQAAAMHSDGAGGDDDSGTCCA